MNFQLVPNSSTQINFALTIFRQNTPVLTSWMAKKEDDMHPNYSPIEVTRQFLAAFAYQDKDSLDMLFVPDVEFNLNCHDKVISGRSSQEVSELLMNERNRWVQSRMDVKSWKNRGPKITVKFHVQFGEDIFTDYLEYIAEIIVQSNAISSLQMICSEKKRSDDLPVWEKPGLSIRNATSS